ncbi:MAG TPA: hypothetical protein VN902_00590 [Candidatus Acidoferrales bacterium]|nr:hypothetical protein [Candidatus Acidoferrales bacterium]
MLSLLLWPAGLLLEFVLLVRSLQIKTFTRYIYFYAYISCVFIVSTGLFIGHSKLGFYEAWYWPTQFATLALGFGVVLEIVRQGLAAYPGAERFARLASCAVFVVTICFVEWWVARHVVWSTEAATVELERDLRVVEALVLSTVLAIVFYYRIEIGRNVTGMIVGFGAYVGVSLTTLALRSFLGPRFDSVWGNLQTASYFFALIVWTVALWSYNPNPRPPTSGQGGGYEALVQGTRAHLESVRSNLRGVAGS